MYRKVVYPSHDVCNFTSNESSRQVRTRLPGETDKVVVSPFSFFFLFCFFVLFMFCLFVCFFLAQLASACYVIEELVHA